VNAFVYGFIDELEKIALEGKSLGRMIKSPYLRGETARFLKSVRASGNKKKAADLLVKYRKGSLAAQGSK